MFLFLGAFIIELYKINIVIVYILYGFIFFMAYLCRVSQPPLDEGGELNNGNNELLEQVQSLEEMIVSSEVICGSNVNETLINQNLATINGKDQMQTLDL